MKKFLLISLVLCLLAVTGFAGEFDNRGTASMAFMKIPVDARGAALGGAGVAMIRDISAIYYNPAGIAGIKGGQFLLSSMDWIADMQMNSVAAVYNFSKLGTFGLNFSYFSMGEMELTTPENPSGEGNIKFNASDLAIGISYARFLTDRFAFGAQAKLLQEKIYNSYANVMGLDIGCQYNTPFEKLRIGMAVKNLAGKTRMSGPDIKGKTQHSSGAPASPDDVPYNLDTKDWNIPFTFQIGFALDVWSAERMKLTATSDFIDENDQVSRFLVGTELNFIDMAFLRIGYNPQYEESNGLNFGGGLHYRFRSMPYAMSLDYAYTDLGLLEQAHRFTFKFLF